MIYAAILAGGSGSRMGRTPMPKQFLELGSQPILIHTVEAFLLHKDIEKTLIIVPEKWKQHTVEIINKAFGKNDSIAVVTGGETRNETIMKGISYIETNFGLKDEDIIVTHDAVRPFLTQRIINDNIQVALEFGAVDTVVPANDTIVQSVNGEEITNIPSRAEMYQGQTPQTFNIKMLKEMYASLTEDEKNILTDTAKICLLKNQEVKLVKGDFFNIKITTPHDFQIAKAIIETKAKTNNEEMYN